MKKERVIHVSALCLICSVKLLSPEVALYLYKSTILPCIEYCCHVWAGTPSCYLELLEKLLKLIHRTESCLTCSVKLLSPEVALYLYKSTILPCIEYCCHVWAGTPSCYLELLEKLLKLIHRTESCLTCSVKLLSPEVALYLYKSTILPCIEYCWALLWKVFIWTGGTGSTSSFSREVLLLFW